MAVHPSAAVIMRPHLPLDQFALVAGLFETRMLSNFGNYTELLEKRASGLLVIKSPLCVSEHDIGLTLAWQALESRRANCRASPSARRSTPCSRTARAGLHRWIKRPIASTSRTSGG